MAPAPGTVLVLRSELPPAGAVLRTFAAEDASAMASPNATLPTAAAKPRERPFSVLLLVHEGGLRAYVNRCAHFGVPLAARVEQLIHDPGVSVTCNVHYARFRWNDGVCDRGDCEGDRLISIALEEDSQGRVCMVAGPA